MEINPVDKILLTERMRTAMTARRQVAALKQVKDDIYESISAVEETVLDLEQLVHSAEGEPESLTAINDLRHQVSRLEIVETGLQELAKVTHVLLSNMMPGEFSSGRPETSTGESTGKSTTETTSTSTSTSTGDVEGSIDGKVDKSVSTGDGEV